MAEQALRFVPGKVTGLPDVTEVAVFPDHLELCSGGEWVVVRFAEIAEWQKPAWLRRWLHMRGWWRQRWLPVGARDWFHPPPERYFEFNTTPRILVYMPDEGETNYHETLFRRVQDVMLQGGFHTWDLG